jgi:serine/threonine-protein kinase HipA
MVHRKDKTIGSPLFVYRTIAGKPVTVGELEFADDSPSGFLAQFHYAQEYLDHDHAFALDPLNLPLSRPSRIFSTTSRYHVLGAIFDAAPDIWGRKVMSAAAGVTQISEKAVLAKGRGMGVGELYFSASAQPEAPVFHPVPHISEIELLTEPIRRIDEGEAFNPAWEDLLVDSWDIGGARPKAILQDHEGEYWIAKFPKKHESYDRQRVEWANLEMAQDIGMNVPAHRLMDTSHGAALLVKRFDRHRAEKRHFLSAASLISPSPSIDKRDIDKPVGQAVFSYARIADVVKRISADPAYDLQELFARMVFNVLIHNVDDHLKNHGFMREPGPRDLYRLSPLYDVVTQEGSSKHMLRIGLNGRESTLENALSDSRRMGIRKEAAAAIAEKARSIVDRRDEYYDKAGLSSPEKAALERCLIWQRSMAASELENADGDIAEVSSPTMGK